MIDNYKYKLNDIFWVVDKNKVVRYYIFNDSFTKIKNLETGKIYAIGELFQRPRYEGSVSRYDSATIVKNACKAEFGDSLSQVMDTATMFHNYFGLLYPDKTKDYKHETKKVDKENNKIDKYNVKKLSEYGELYEDEMLDHKSIDYYKILGTDSFDLSQLSNLKSRYQRVVNADKEIEKAAKEREYRNDPHLNF
jgi:hypothetical protein